MNLPNDKPPGRMIFRPIVKRMNEEKRMNLPNDFCCEMMRLMVVEEGDVFFSEKQGGFFLLSSKGKKVVQIPICYCPWCGRVIEGK